MRIEGIAVDEASMLLIQTALVEKPQAGNQIFTTVSKLSNKIKANN